MVNIEKNKMIYKCLFEDGLGIPETAHKTGETNECIRRIYKDVLSKSYTKQQFIYSHNFQIKTGHHKWQWETGRAICKPKYQVGDVVNKKYIIIRVFEDKINRYLCTNGQYRKMFFEDEIEEERT